MHFLILEYSKDSKIIDLKNYVRNEQDFKIHKCNFTHEFNNYCMRGLITISKFAVTSILFFE